MPVFSSTHSTTAASGGFKYSPTTSRTLSTNCGSGDTLNSSTRWGLSPNARHIWLTAVCETPAAAAIDRVDQCVASRGAVSSVRTNTSSITASVILRGGPGRGSSASPSRRRSANLRRHLLTVAAWQPNAAAISLLWRPSAAASTIRHRSASA